MSDLIAAVGIITAAVGAFSGAGILLVLACVVVIVFIAWTKIKRARDEH